MDNINPSSYDQRPVILVVDDIRANLEILSTLLSADYRVLVAGTGASALALAADLPQPDLILLDVNMPQMNGYQVCQKLRENPLTVDIPVIFISALTDHSAETYGLELGAVDYISKPFNPGITLQRVRNQVLLKQHKSQLKDNEQRLKASETYLRAIFAATPDAMLISDEQGIIKMVNQQTEKLLGYRDDELIGQAIEMLVPERYRAGHPEQRAHYAANATIRLMGARPPVSAVCKNGSEVNVEISLSPIQTEQGLFFASAVRDITDRVQAIAKLQKSEQRFRNMANSSPIMIWLTDADGEPVFANQAWLDFTGLASAREMTHQNWLSTVHPEDRDTAFVEYYKNTTAREAIASEYRLRNAAGEWRHLFDKGMPLYDENGAFNGYIGSAIDVTEYRKAQQLIRDKEHMLSESQRIARIGSWSVELASGCISWSDELYRIFGVAPESFDPHFKAVISRIHDDDRQMVKTWVDACIAGQQPQELDFRVLLTNGAIRHVRGSGGLQYNQQNKPQPLVGSIQDITERKQLEIDQRIAAIAFESQEAMAITDTSNTILRVNQAFCTSTGYSEEDVIGRKISIVKSGRHDAAFYAKMWKVILSTGTWRGEVWDRRKNGEIYPKWLTITAVKGADGVVSHYVSTHADITERKMSEDQIKKLAFYDPLTELPNRRLLQERIKHSISMERRDGRQMALLMLDLDRFKAVNDNLGHLAGDELLQQVAGRISARLREVDMVARLGGDEFIILLEDIVQPEDAALVAKEIIADLSKPFKLSQCDDVHIGGSIGISLHPQHGDNADTLMDHADAALYQAKGAGRGCFAYFSKDQTIAARERIALESRLRHALEQQQLLVFFQPQIDIASGCSIGAEALVRWQDPVDGLVMPSRFIPIAEETGLIVEIGAWVLQETCRQGREWLDAGLPAITLAVNVSPHQFQRGDICALVAKVLKQTGFPPGQLELEITETGLMDNQAIAVDILNDLRAQGVRFAIDDFGTGYSSLSYLKLFPLNVLKIDKSFIDDIPSSQGDMEIAATIIAMGHILGFKVLAEGVETAKQLAFLQEKGCNSYQGFINSQPIPVAEFDQLLRRQQRGD